MQVIADKIKVQHCFTLNASTVDADEGARSSLLSNKESCKREASGRIFDVGEIIGDVVDVTIGELDEVELDISIDAEKGGALTKDEVKDPEDNFLLSVVDIARDIYETDGFDKRKGLSIASTRSPTTICITKRTRLPPRQLCWSKQHDQR